MEKNFHLGIIGQICISR